MRKDNLKDFLLITIGILLVAISVVYFFLSNMRLWYDRRYLKMQCLEKVYNFS